MQFLIRLIQEDHLLDMRVKLYAQIDVGAPHRGQGDIAVQIIEAV